MSEERVQGYWPEILVEEIRTFLTKGLPDCDEVPNAFVLRSNIAYNMQYLMMLNERYKERNHSVIYSLIEKNFVVVSCGIMEAILYYIVKSKKLETYKKWEEISKHDCNGIKGLADNNKATLIIYSKLLEPTMEPLTFDRLAKIAARKNLIKNFDMHKELSYLRKLRNKVHLQIAANWEENDYRQFSGRHINAAKAILYDIFSSELFSPKEKHLKVISFLKIQDRPTLEEI